jgi:hypothetical protein
MSTSPFALANLWSHGSTVMLGQVITWSLLDWPWMASPLLPQHDENFYIVMLGLAAA